MRGRTIPMFGQQPHTDAPRYWLIPAEDFARLDAEFGFDFDPCPYPRPAGFDGLAVDWGAMNWVNPPYRKTDGNTDGPTAFVRKAIEEQQKGRTSVLILPVQSYINLLLEAGAELRPGGRMRFLEVDSKEPLPAPSPTIYAVLRGRYVDGTQADDGVDSTTPRRPEGALATKRKAAGG